MNPACIRAVAMFKGSSNLHDIVKMCANHAENSNEGGLRSKRFKVTPFRTALHKTIDTFPSLGIIQDVQNK
jgi:hypothetical protein